LDHPDSPYSVAEYKNMVGRAGRLGFTPKGKSFLIASNSAEGYKLWNNYVLGKPEPLISRFSDQDPLSLICRVLATATGAKTNGLTEQELTDFIQSTFAAHRKHQIFTSHPLSTALSRLVNSGLVEKTDDRHRLTELGKVAGELGIHVESVVRIAQALRGLPRLQLTERVLLAAAQTSHELDDIIFPVHKRSTKERQRWQGAIQAQRLPACVGQALRATDDTTYTTRCKKLSAVLMWIDGTELNQLEASILIHMPGDNAAGPIRSVAERTRDLIAVVARIGTLVSAEKRIDLATEVDELNARIEIGLPKQMVPLAKRIKRGLDRGDYLRLQRAKLTDPQDIMAAEDSILATLLNNKNKVRLVKEAASAIIADMQADNGALPMPKPPLD
jgi:hypothetical protein